MMIDYYTTVDDSISVVGIKDRCVRKLCVVIRHFVRVICKLTSLRISSVLLYDEI